ncbi:nucleoside-diphosphate kinase [Chondrus crispus]|uniref:nucleoside-diphosphate kinase n=1 Tax=Chondrus crispus TaxID=2769 RepID=R7QBR9_CHOCR|nr:nucleoside-diphosphate kinase [Chondrus crispus]CDF35947.1 nucleoside-diphosphate kinase [Chondrus crispus]|eukprot:XP_005715766.1 nucleoside-diphosphate kinase [Chondrus crispus]
MSQDERTFIALKPDGMNRGLLGNIISRFEAKGYKLVGIKTLVPSRQLAETHYASLSSKPFFAGLVDFITSGPVCAMVWEGAGVVTTARKMIGETNPLSSNPGTIRGDFGVDVGRNGSDAVDTATREIGIWFEPSELCTWSPTASVWIYE